MALLYWDGFDLYSSSAAWQQADPTVTSNDFTNGFATSGGRWNGGRYAGRHTYALTDYFHYFQHNLAAIQTEVWVGCSWALTDPAYGGGVAYDNQGVIAFISSGGTEFELIYDYSTNKFSVKRGSTVLASTTPGDIARGSSGAWLWHFIEIRYKYGLSNGEIEVWFDNVRKINLTNIQTYALGNDNGISAVRWLNGTSAATIDDPYVLNTTGSAPTNTRIGDMRIYKMTMNSDAGPNNGTPSTGSTHYGVVTDNNSSTYVNIPNGTSNSTMFGHTSMPTTATEVVALGVIAYAYKSDAGTAFGHVKINSSGTGANGASRALLSGVQVFKETFSSDPATSSAWSVSNINSVKIGWEVE